MTLRLILTRHAKSSWNQPALDDHARPLNGRGRDSARAIGGWMKQKGYVPQSVLSSDSNRTRETWDLIESALGSGAKVTWTSALYHADSRGMLAVLQEAGPVQSVLLLAHNPGIAGFANLLVSMAPRHSRFRDYPTAATTVIDFDVADWAEVDWGAGEAVDFVIPREL